VLFLSVLELAKSESEYPIRLQGEFLVMESYPPGVLDRRLQEDWARDAREGPRVLIAFIIFGHQTQIHNFIFSIFK